jgi:hypothetical protein
MFRIRRRVFPQPPISVRVCNQGTAAEVGGSNFSVTALLTETIRRGQRRFWRGVYSASQDLQNLSRDFVEALHLSVIFSLAFSKSELPKFKNCPNSRIARIFSLAFSKSELPESFHWLSQIQELPESFHWLSQNKNCPNSRIARIRHSGLPNDVHFSSLFRPQTL